MDLLERVRTTWPWLLALSMVLVLGVFFLRRAGLISESVTLTAPATLRPGDTAGEGRTVQLVTLLPKDAIPAIFNPEFVNAEAADEQLDDADLVIGVSLGGEHKAYGVAHLSSHEVVNDRLGGTAIAVTW